MSTDFFALVSFVLVTTFTPGPNNVSSASMGILHGYRATLRYLSGISTGTFLVMLLCGWISSTLLQVFPAFEGILRVIGALYILWLAFHTLKASYAFEEDERTSLGFSEGLVLQVLNPKLIVYGLTLYSTFLAGVVTNYAHLLLSALIVTAVGFCSISTWTILGATIRAHLDRPRVKQVLNTALSLLLVYTAIELSGLFDVLSRLI
jgi:cysteine/O-acetylserine efflux protein